MPKSTRRKNDGQLPLINQFKDERPKDERPKGMPTLDQIRVECALHGLPFSDAAYIYDHWLTNGFKTGRGLTIKNWTAAIRVWKTNGWFASQKLNKQFKHNDAAAERRAATFRRIRDGQDTP
jgi:hypothetical protein